ncbi:hypothetical protein GYMLUDRAFT_395749 [Collybiopsis luxurians FD-317 M1]|uniref:Unplaced genomic scaffold GYMLUscaffold_117, whole genome shotgun sequence n=1 Tax=Collybiopsis luxurians FD-317 M1 TaxID=944289 RepID=A0A0D0AM93_9AGAR|nr:hypothetical protein GYMLUDRAFT_395749 [Collybiopsis luxurians FD-317 M1]
MMMPIMKLFLLSISVANTIIFTEAPQAVSLLTTTATLYNVIPTQAVSLPDNDSYTNLIMFDHISGPTETILGVSSGPQGSETTYSFGEYISNDVIYTTTITGSQGQATVETVVTPYLVGYTNWTVVESDGGQWVTYSPYISSEHVHNNTFTVDGGYASCSFDSSHQKGFCTGVDLEPVVTTLTDSNSQVATVTEVKTFSESYEGSVSAFTTITLPSRTGLGSGSSATGGSSNAAITKYRTYGFGGYIIMAVAVNMYTDWI